MLYIYYAYTKILIYSNVNVTNAFLSTLFWGYLVPAYHFDGISRCVSFLQHSPLCVSFYHPREKCP